MTHRVCNAGLVVESVRFEARDNEFAYQHLDTRDYCTHGVSGALAHANDGTLCCVAHGLALEPSAHGWRHAFDQSVCRETLAAIVSSSEGRQPMSEHPEFETHSDGFMRCHAHHRIVDRTGTPDATTFTHLDDGSRCTPTATAKHAFPRESMHEKPRHVPEEANTPWRPELPLPKPDTPHATHMEASFSTETLRDIMSTPTPCIEHRRPAVLKGFGTLRAAWRHVDDDSFCHWPMIGTTATLSPRERPPREPPPEEPFIDSDDLWETPAGDASAPVATRARLPAPASRAARDLLFPHSAHADVTQRARPGISFVAAERVDPAHCGGYVVRLRGTLGRRFVNWYARDVSEMRDAAMHDLVDVAGFSTLVFPLDALVYTDDDAYDRVEGLSSDQFTFAEPPPPTGFTAQGVLVYGNPASETRVHDARAADKQFIAGALPPDDRDRFVNGAWTFRMIDGAELTLDTTEQGPLKGIPGTEPIVSELRPDDQESRLDE